MNKEYTPDFETIVQKTVEMPPASTEFVDSLWKRLLAQPVRRPAPASRLLPMLRSRLAIAVMVVLILLISLAAIGPQRVLAAVQALLHYLPGVGQVQNIEQAAILAEPVRTERAGYAVTVENLVASPERTWLRLKIEGWPADTDFSDLLRLYSEAPFLQFDDNSQLQPNQADIYLSDAWYAEYQYPPIPANTEQVTLILQRVPGAGEATVSENWVFTLNLRTAEQKDTLPEAWSAPRSSSMVNGVVMSILQIARDAEHTWFTVRFQTPTLNDFLASDLYSHLSLQDAQGRIYPAQFEESISGRTFMFRTRSFAGAENLTLRVDRLLLVGVQPADGTAPAFTFEAGEHPAIGQRWVLDQIIRSGEFELKVNGASLQEDEDGLLWLVFEVEGADENVQGVMLGCAYPVCLQSTTDDLGNSAGGRFFPAIQLGGMPAGKINIELRNLYYLVEGPWEFQWQPASVPVALRSQSAVPAATLTPVRPVTSTPAAISTPSAQSLNEQLADEVRELLEKGFAEIYGQVGWVHLASENIEAEDTEDYHSGRLIGPAHSIIDTWQYVEVDGTLSRQVWVVKAQDGAVWHRMAQVGQTVVNFTAGTAVDDPSLLAKAHIDSLPDQILNAKTSPFPLQVIRNETDLDGNPCLLVTLRTVFDPPIDITSIPQKVAWSESNTWIDQEAGQIARKEIVYGFEDGTRFVLQTMLYTTWERIDEPPPEVIELINQVVPAPQD